MNESRFEDRTGATGGHGPIDFARGGAEPAGEAAPRLALPWVVRLRYGMVGSGAAALLTVAPILEIPRWAVMWAFVPLVLMLVSNLWLRRARGWPAARVQRMLGQIFVFDTVCLTVLLGLTGGPMNPFSLLYLVQITLSVVALKKEWPWILGGLSAASFGLLFFLNVPLDGMRIMPGDHGMFPHLVGMWAAFVVAAALISFFTGRVAESLRLREQEVLGLQEQIARQEKLASLGTLAAGAAHELGTPLGTIAIAAREMELYAASGQDGDELGDDARLIRTEVERCQEILKRMRAEGEEPVGEIPKQITLGELLRRMRGEISAAMRERVLMNAEAEGEVVILPVAMTVQSLAALVGNALDASGDGDPVVVKAECNGSEVVFSICDRGCGMEEEVLRHVGEPFFTTKEPGNGMGLGTFLVRSFAERVGGSLLFDSGPGQGTVARLTLPIRMEMLERGARANG